MTRHSEVGEISEKIKNRFFVYFKEPQHSESFRDYLLEVKAVAGPSELMFNVKIKEVVSSEYNVGVVGIEREKLVSFLDGWRRTLH